jgi:hypothetical protein
VLDIGTLLRSTIAHLTQQPAAIAAEIDVRPVISCESVESLVDFASGAIDAKLYRLIVVHDPGGGPWRRDLLDAVCALCSIHRG